MATGTQLRQALGQSNAFQRRAASLNVRARTLPGTLLGGFLDGTASPLCEGTVPAGAYAAYTAIWREFTLDPVTGTLNFVSGTFSGTGTLTTSRQFAVGVVRTFTGTGTLALRRLISLNKSFAGTGTLTLQRLISVSKAFAATGSLAVTASKAFFVAANMAATGTLVAAKQLSMGVSRAFNAVGTLVTGQSFIPGSIGPVILSEYVRRFMTYLGRRW